MGETRDTNSGEIARSLTEAGVAIDRIDVLPDRLRVVAGTFRAALRRADLVDLDRRPGPDAGRPDPRGDRPVTGETPTVDPELEAWLRELWSTPEPALPRDQSQAGLADPQRSCPGQPERHGSRLVGRAARRPGGRPAARAAARDAPDVDRPGPAPARRARPGSRPDQPDPAPDRDRRIAGCRPARRGDPAPGQPGDRDLCPGRGGRRPDLGHGPAAAGSADDLARRGRGPGPRAARASTCGPAAPRPGSRRSAPS